MVRGGEAGEGQHEVQGRPRGAGKAPPTASETGSSWSGDSREVSIERDPS